MKSLVAWIAAFVTLATLALAEVPKTISYHGYLKNTDGTPVTTSISVRFSLYSSNPPRNNPVWQETQSVTPQNGVYSVVLGSVTPVTAPLDVPHHLGIKVETDAEMPLQPLTSVPYALRAASVQCVPGDFVNCYSGDPATFNVGLCRPGIRTCSNDGTFGVCTGEIIPVEENCRNEADDNCNGQTNEGCSRSDGQTCTAAYQCASGICSNGFCCSSETGLCCATNDDCSSLNQPGICSNPYFNCMSKKTVGICNSSNVCVSALMDDPAACLGQTCSDGTCTGTGNLTWTPKGVCSENGICSLTGSMMSCDDANPCTNDFCSPATGCSHPFNNTVTLSCYKDSLGNPLGGTPGVGVCANGTQQCSNGAWGTCVGAVGPSYEVCGGLVDEDCDGQTNEQDALGCTWVRLDNDSDGYGVDITRCYCTAGYSRVGAASDKFTAGISGAFDCNDSTALARPGMTETCDYSYDEDCDGSVNEDNAGNCLTRYLDNDRDGYGTALSKCSCVVASPYDSQYSSDCNDSNASVSPGKTEICNGIDDNCSGTVDTAEVPIVTLCPTMVNATTSVCNGASGCSPVCATYWWDVDLTYANGCEAQEDVYDRSGNNESCPGYYAGTLYEYTASPYLTDLTGNILPSTDSDYYYFNAADSSGNGTVRLDVRFIVNVNSTFRYNVYNSTSCTTTLVSGQTASNLFTTPGYYVVRVYRYGGGASPAGETYQIRLSSGVY